MNSEYHVTEKNRDMSGGEMLREASECFLMNLPLLVCGMVIGLAIAMDMLA